MLRLSQLENKPERRLKAMMKKQWIAIRKLQAILKTSYDFDIPLSPITVGAIEDKIRYHEHENLKISSVWNVRFNDQYKGSYGRWAE